MRDSGRADAGRSRHQYPPVLRQDPVRQRVVDSPCRSLVPAVSRQVCQRRKLEGQRRHLGQRRHGRRPRRVARQQVDVRVWQRRLRVVKRAHQSRPDVHRQFEQRRRCLPHPGVGGRQRLVVAGQGASDDPDGRLEQVAVASSPRERACPNDLVGLEVPENEREWDGEG